MAVPTLAALALYADAGDAPVAALLDARRGEVYAAVYDGGPTALPRLAPCVVDPETLAARLAEIAGARPCVAIGDGVAVAAEALRTRLGERVLLRPVAPDAAAVGRLGQRLLARLGRRLPGAAGAALRAPRGGRGAAHGRALRAFDTPEKVS